MGLAERLGEEMKSALKSHDDLRLQALRLLKSAVHNKEIELRRPLEEAEIQGVVSTLVKQRHESIDLFRKGGRLDLAEKEEREIRVLEGYLPPSLSEGELDALIAAAVSESGAAAPKDLGRVMKVLMPKVAGRAEGNRVRERVMARLGGAGSPSGGKP